METLGSQMSLLSTDMSLVENREMTSSRKGQSTKQNSGEKRNYLLISYSFVVHSHETH